jgi:lipid-A-disaccharide synthase
MPPSLNVLVCSGELSGDLVAASYVAYLVERGVRCFGLGGQRLVDLGLEPICKRDGVSVTGLSEALGGLLPTLKVYKQLADAVGSADAVLLCDFPEVNLRLLRIAHRRGIPAIYLAPPQAWAWRPWRYKRLLAADFVGCLFPFSSQWYQSHGVRADWIGHPLAQASSPVLSSSNHVSIMPGSRVATIRRVLPSMLNLADQMAAQNPQLRFTLVLSPEVAQSEVSEIISTRVASVSISQDVEMSLSRSVLALTHPGTATLHAVLRGCIPLSMCNPAQLTRILGPRLIRVEHLALPNLILKQRCFPEFFLPVREPDELLQTALSILETPLSFQAAVTQVWRSCRRNDKGVGVEKALEPLFS